MAPERPFRSNSEPPVGVLSPVSRQNPPHDPCRKSCHFGFVVQPLPPTPRLPKSRVRRRETRSEASILRNLALRLYSTSDSPLMSSVGTEASGRRWQYHDRRARWREELHDRCGTREHRKDRGRGELHEDSQAQQGRDGRCHAGPRAKRGQPAEGKPAASARA